MEHDDILINTKDTLIEFNQENLNAVPIGMIFNSTLNEKNNYKKSKKIILETENNLNNENNTEDNFLPKIEYISGSRKITGKSNYIITNSLIQIVSTVMLSVYNCITDNTYQLETNMNITYSISKGKIIIDNKSENNYIINYIIIFN